MKAIPTSRRGFTLIELMIVIIVIAILALIVIPKLAGASRKAKESAMQANMQTIRNAVEQFQADTGTYPASLADLYAAAGSDPTGTPTGTYKGPYLKSQGAVVTGTSIPKNPMVADTITTAECASPAATPTAHWAYTASTGNVSPGISGSTADGNIDYSQL